MKRGTLACLLGVMLAVSLVLTGCGGDTGGDTPTAISASGGSGGTVTAATDVTPAATHVTTQASAKIGEAVPVKDYMVSLDSATLDGGSLKASFTFDNTKGSGTVNLPGTAFNANQTVGGAALDPDIVCTTLPVSVPQGKKIQGLVCWKAPGATATTGMQVQYDAGRLGGAVVNWTLP